MNRRLVKVAIIFFVAVVLQACATLPADEHSFTADTRPELGIRLRVISVENWPKAIVGNRANLLKVVALKEQLSAAQAGLREGDIILELNEIPVSGMADSVAIIQQHSWGEAVLVTVWRDQTINKIPVLLNKKGKLSRSAATKSDNVTVAGTKITSLVSEHTDTSIQTTESFQTTKLKESDAPPANSTPIISKVAATRTSSPVAYPASEFAKGTSAEAGDEPSSKIQVVLEDNTLVYPTASISTRTVATVNRYELLSVVDRVGNWLHVDSAHGYTGYVHLSKLGLPKTLSQRLVLKQRTNVRKGPGLSYDILSSLDKHRLVTVIEDHKDWLQILQVDNANVGGYVHSSLLGAQPVMR